MFNLYFNTDGQPETNPIRDKFDGTVEAHFTPDEDGFESYETVTFSPQEAPLDPPTEP